MVRFPDWPDRLHRFIAQRQDRRFKWGVQDCALFACDAVVEMTGVDLVADFRDAYANAEQAREKLEAFAGDLQAAAERIAMQHDIQETPIGLAQRGDIALIDMGEDEAFPHAIALVMVGHVIAPSMGAIERAPLSRVRQVWAVGRDV